MAFKLYALSALGGVTGTSTVAAPVLKSYATNYIDSHVKDVRKAAEATQRENSKLKNENETLKRTNENLKEEKNKVEALKRLAEQGKNKAEKDRDWAKTRESNLVKQNRHLQTSQSNYSRAANDAQGELNQLKGNFDSRVDEELRKKFSDFISVNKTKLYPLIEKQINSHSGGTLTTSDIGWSCRNVTWRSSTETNRTRGVAYCVLPPDSKDANRTRRPVQK